MSKENDKEYLRALAQAYAKHLEEEGLEPGDPTFVEPEDILPEEPAEEIVIEEAAAITEETVTITEETEEITEETSVEISEAKPEEKSKKFFEIKHKRRQPPKVKIKPYEKSSKGVSFLSKIIDAGDSVQIKFDEGAATMGKDFIRTAHNVATTYRNTRRTIGMALLGIGVIASAILVIFDSFTVYEYAYNGKVLGYVKEQEEVTDVLEIAGEKLSENSGSSLNIEFKPNQNLTFNQVDASGKSLDDADTAVNKLVYMTDIETEAYGVYDGEDSLVAIVKSNEDAEELLLAAKSELSTPDRGMQLVSSEFDNQLNIKPLNVLLTSVQDNNTARKQMVEGGNIDIYHIVEEGETLESLAADYTVDLTSIYDEMNKELATEIETGDKVCIHKTVEPVTVTMVEEGQLKETVEYKTVKKETDELYKGDTFIEQEGRNGVQIFEGKITKKSGEVVDRDGEIVEVTRKVRNKIILIGTAERPKTAPTGTYVIPIARYTFTSGFGARWGRQHTGVDLAAPVGTPIYATDGGTVIRSSYYTSYGNCIDIDHGGGRVTRYAHCSRLLVSAGEKVYQGQQIALCGSTGNSTGPHLHFEIRINGSPINPAPKLGL